MTFSFMKRGGSKQSTHVQPPLKVAKKGGDLRLKTPSNDMKAFKFQFTSKKSPSIARPSMIRSAVPMFPFKFQMKPSNEEEKNDLSMDQAPIPTCKSEKVLINESPTVVQSEPLKMDQETKKKAPVFGLGKVKPLLFQSGEKKPCFQMKPTKLKHETPTAVVKKEKTPPPPATEPMDEQLIEVHEEMIDPIVDIHHEDIVASKELPQQVLSIDPSMVNEESAPFPASPESIDSPIPKESPLLFKTPAVVFDMRQEQIAVAPDPADIAAAIENPMDSEMFNLLSELEILLQRTETGESMAELERQCKILAFDEIPTVLADSVVSVNFVELPDFRKSYASKANMLGDSAVCYQTQLSCGPSTKSIMLYPGIPLEELERTIHITFATGNADIVGLKDKSQGVHFPLSLLSKAPAYFASKNNAEYELILNGSKQQTTSKVLDLSELDLNELITIFTQASPTGVLDRSTFEKCCLKIYKQNPSLDSTVRMTLNHLFNVFDTQNQDVIDTTEFLSGLSVLANGDRDQKIKATFDLYDVNKDQYVSMNEMTRYLTSVFAVIAEASPHMFQQHNVDPRELGQVTARQCFAEADLDQDGRLSFDEFKKWYTKPGGYLKAGVAPTQSTEDISLDEIRRRTGLGNYSVEDVFAVFKEAASDGVITRNEFKQCLTKLLPESATSSDIINRLFGIFDADGDGAVDLNELSSGLSILCGGSQTDRVAAAFSLFDTNGDGYIGKDEMEMYLTSVYKILFDTSSETRQNIPLDPEALAKITTEQAFKEADKNEDGRLTFDEFAAWYSDGFSAIPQANHQNLKKILSRVRRVTTLGSKNAADVFEVFATGANEEGVLDRNAFNRCFRHVIGQDSESFSEKDQADAKRIIDQMFDIFDKDGDGAVDFVELSSGLTILCGGSSHEKVEAAFTLYDINGDGYISPQELQLYLLSVFRLLYGVNPDLSQEIGLSAEELAQHTAAQAFADADLNQDGRLSHEEFTKWYLSSGFGVTNDSVNEPSLSDVTSALREARRLTNLHSYDAQDVFDFLQSSAGGEGALTKQQFFRCFNKLIHKTGGQDRSLQPQTKDLLDRLFQIFDSDENGVVDVHECAAGLSLLCGGSAEEKARAAFALYDTNHDKFISFDEMVHYLTSVFKVLFESNAELRRALNVSAQDFAVATAHKCFMDCDLNNDGKLSFDEFQLWYSNIGNQQNDVDDEEKEDEGEGVNTLDDVRRLTNLQSYTADQVFEIFAEGADQDGMLDHESFYGCFNRIIGSNETESENTQMVVDRIFDIFDTNDNGKVDFSELSSGLSVLCGGTREEKVEAAFGLFDFDGDGYISQPEMEKYLCSVFRVLYQVSPENESHMGISPDELAMITTEEAFKEADLDGDGRISLEEFQQWYEKPSGFQLNPEKVMNQTEDYFSLAEIRRLSKLECFTPMFVFEALAERSDEEGYVSKQAFDECFRSLIQQAGTELTSEDENRLGKVLDRLFNIFDQDQNGLVDFSEISGGLSVLCGGDRDEKVQAAFSLYDFNGDGFISLDEMTRYLVSVFRVLHETNPQKLQQMGVSPEELGAITAEQAFEEADQNQDGLLSFDEFCQWYSTTAVTQMVEQAVPDWWSLDEIRKLTKLDQLKSEDVFEALAEAADESGRLNKQAFIQCFEQFVYDLSSRPVDMDRLRIIIDRLFGVFDRDGNGLLDFSELASGLSVLCGGTRDEKVKSAFALYDYNGDGFITQDEMAAYLTSVFRILFETSRETRDRLGVSAEELGRITAEQAFLDADTNKDGKLSFEEFQKWYLESDQSLIAPNVQSEPPTSLEKIRKLLKLDTLRVDEVLSIFAEVSPNGELTFPAFRKCFNDIIELSGGHESTIERDAAEKLIYRLFHLFDTDDNQSVDFSELAAGISVLSGSSMDDKVLAAFQLYDTNNDGYISLDEMIHYMTSVFKVMYETSGTRDKLGISPEELAKVTATQCFKDADLNQDDKLSFHEFKSWCTSSMG